MEPTWPPTRRAPQQPGGPGIVVLPDVRGLHPFFEELALRFAEAGVHAVAIDYFSRTAGHRTAPGRIRVRGAREAAGAPTASMPTSPRRSRSCAPPDGGSAERLYTVGFCIGGRISFVQAATQDGLAGVIGFYGWPIGEHRSGLPSPADAGRPHDLPGAGAVGRRRSGHRSGGSGRVRGRAAGSGRRAPQHHLPRCAALVLRPHRRPSYANESEDAWRQMLDFIGIGGGAAG